MENFFGSEGQFSKGMILFFSRLLQALESQS